MIRLEVDAWGVVASASVLEAGSGYDAPVIITAPAPESPDPAYDDPPSGVSYIPQGGFCWRVCADAGGFSIKPLTTRPRCVTVLESAPLSGYAAETFEREEGFLPPLYTDPGVFGSMETKRAGLGECFVWGENMTATVFNESVPASSPGFVLIRFYRVEVLDVAYATAEKFTGADDAVALISEGSGWLPVATDLLGTATIPAAAFTDNGSGLCDPVEIPLPTIAPGTIVSAIWELPTPVTDGPDRMFFTVHIISDLAPPPIGVHDSAESYAWPTPPA